MAKEAARVAMEGVHFELNADDGITWLISKWLAHGPQILRAISSTKIAGGMFQTDIAYEAGKKDGEKMGYSHGYHDGQADMRDK